MKLPKAKKKSALRVPLPPQLLFMLLRYLPQPLRLPPLPLLRLQAGMGLPTRVREGTTDVALEDAPEARDA